MYKRGTHIAHTQRTGRKKSLLVPHSHGPLRELLHFPFSPFCLVRLSLSIKSFLLFFSAFARSLFGDEGGGGPRRLNHTEAECECVAVKDSRTYDFICNRQVAAVFLSFFFFFIIPAPSSPPSIQLLLFRLISCSKYINQFNIRSNSIHFHKRKSSSPGANS